MWLRGKSDRGGTSETLTARWTLACSEGLFNRKYVFVNIPAKKNVPHFREDSRGALNSASELRVSTTFCEGLWGIPVCHAHRESTIDEASSFL